MDKASATQVFAGFLVSKGMELGEPLAAVSSQPERLSSGWAFYYQSHAYLETGDLGRMLVGHGPVVITDDGRTIEGGSLDRDLEALLTR